MKINILSEVTMTIMLGIEYGIGFILMKIWVLK